MSTTKQQIDFMKPFCGNWSRSTGVQSILKLMEECQDDLFDYDAPQMKYLKGSENQGWVPYLTTVAGTYEYEITAANLTNVDSLVRTISGTDYPIRAKKVIKVLGDATKIDYNRRWIGEPYLYAWNNPYTSDFTRIDVVEFPVEMWEATDLENCRIIFKEDPGNSTEEFFVVFTIEPPRLTSENVPLLLPTAYEPAVRDYVLGTIEMLDNGKMGQRLERYFKYWKPKFQMQMSSGSQITPKQVRPRFC